MQLQGSKFSINKEIIVIDDASTDHTPSILKSLQKKYSLTIIRHTVNNGKGAAIRSGLGRATGDYFIIQDADLEYNPNEYPKLIQPLTHGESDVVFGNRMRLQVEPEFYLSLLGNKLLTFFTNLLFGSSLSDVFVGYKAFSRKAIEGFHPGSNGFDIEIELAAHFLKHGYMIKEVPISYHGRGWDEGKKITVRDGLISLYKIVKYKFAKD